MTGDLTSAPTGAATDGSGLGGGLVDFGAVSGWTLVALAGVVLGTWLAGRYARRWVLRGLGRIDGVSAELRVTCARIVGYFILLVGAGLGLTVLGAEVQPVLAAAIIVAAVVVLALRGVADNFGASVILQTRKPVRHGDWVDLDGTYGCVVEMNARSVVLTTSDGRQIHVPNTVLLGAPIVNLTVGGGLRSEIELRTEDVARRSEAADAAVVACAAVHGVQESPAPDVVWTSTSPTSTTGRLRYVTEAAQVAPVGSRVLEAVAEALASRGLEAWLTTSPADETVRVVRNP